MDRNRLVSHYPSIPRNEVVEGEVLAERDRCPRCRVGDDHRFRADALNKDPELIGLCQTGRPHRHTASGVSWPLPQLANHRRLRLQKRIANVLLDRSLDRA